MLRERILPILNLPLVVDTIWYGIDTPIIIIFNWKNEMSTKKNIEQVVIVTFRSSSYSFPANTLMYIYTDQLS